MVRIIEEKKAEEAKKIEFHPVNVSAEKKKLPWTLIIIAAVIIAAALIFFLFLYKPNSGITAQTLKIQYLMQLDDGTVIGNQTIEIPKDSLASTLGISSDSIDSLADSMTVGDEKEISLNASDAFGAYDPSKVEIINRTSEIKRKDEINKTISVSAVLFKNVFKEDAVLNKTYSATGSPWDYKVIELNNNTDIVKLDQLAIANSTIPLSEILDMKIVEVTSEKIKTEIEAQEQTLEIPTGNLTIKVSTDYIYFTLTPPLGQRIEIGGESAKVLSYNDTSIVLDYNGEYAGQNITLKLKLLDKKTISSSGYSAKDIAGAPVLDVFVMSYCPYGTQIEKALIPAWNLLKDKANIKVRFVSYVMHGDKEEQENKRQLCLREETDKFWSYLECFLEAGDSAGCLNKLNVDSAKLSSCMSTKADSYWQIDKDLNTKYGVQGSPTVVLDGKVVQVARSPEAIKESVCNAFASKPSECSQALSSTAATAGFGYSTSSSSSTSSSGGCVSA